MTTIIWRECGRCCRRGLGEFSASILKTRPQGAPGSTEGISGNLHSILLRYLRSDLLLLKFGRSSSQALYAFGDRRMRGKQVAEAHASEQGLNNEEVRG